MPAERYELIKGATRKFWEIARAQRSLTFHWGRIGTKGQSKVRRFATDEKAAAFAGAVIAEKIKKGYRAINPSGSAGTSFAARREEHLIWVDQHVVTLKDSKAVWNGRWTNDPFGKHSGLGVAEGVASFVGLCRAAGNIPVFFEISPTPPPADDLADYDGVLEGSLVAPSRKLSLENESNAVAVVPLPAVPGDAWRLRVYFANGDTARYDYSDGAEHLRIALFPGSGPVKVLKPKVRSSGNAQKYRGRRSEKELLAMLRGDNPSHRCLAAVALLQKGKLAPVLAAAKKPSAVRRAVASTAWVVGPPSHRVLAALAKDRDADIRTRAATSIGLTRAPSLHRVLVMLGKDRQRAVRDEAAQFLEQG